MKVVRLIPTPEAGLLVTFDPITKQASFTLLRASSIDRLLDDCEEAVQVLRQPAQLRVIEPEPKP